MKLITGQRPNILLAFFKILRPNRKGTEWFGPNLAYYHFYHFWLVCWFLTKGGILTKCYIPLWSVSHELSFKLRTSSKRPSSKWGSRVGAACVINTPIAKVTERVLNALALLAIMVMEFFVKNETVLLIIHVRKTRSVKVMSVFVNQDQRLARNQLFRNSCFIFPTPCLKTWNKNRRILD